MGDEINEVLVPDGSDCGVQVGDEINEVIGDQSVGCK